MPFAKKSRLTPSGMESRIRRAAEKAGLRAVRSRWRRGTPENLGGWLILAGNSSIRVVTGRFYSLTDADALAFLEKFPRTTALTKARA